MSHRTQKALDNAVKAAMWRDRGDRCVECGRVVTYRLVELGLGIVSPIDGRMRRTPDGDVYFVSDARHTFPCVGRKIDLKSICAHYVQLAALFSPAPAQEMK